MSTGEKIFNRVRAASESNLQASAVQLASKRELRALVTYCEATPEAEQVHEVLAQAMVEIVRRFMKRGKDKS